MTEPTKARAAPARPKNGTFRILGMAENGAPLIEDDREVTMPGHLRAFVGNFVEVRFDDDDVAHAVQVL